MRLSKIKLAGFKSFVDPTTLNLPGNLTGIVGPNGCGKSNVIDAVRWVMGETSAKHLRGTSMEDVIFNGSSSRKPVGLASVELIFDNSETHGKVGGQYAEYDEISVKRAVTRDGQSKYSLNGTRCRRRDIADLFLGTGLGPRSYAIIEQGMISRLIEAKPEELRVFIEEAAGISKYKERRKETENRIRHTRDNLERLKDLREEIEKQLTHLQRQSRAAERYKELKQEERKLKAELLALRWKELNTELQIRDRKISESETEMQQIIAEQRATESKIEAQRQLHSDSNDDLSEIQEKYYRIGAEISRVEQNIKHQHDLHQRQATDLEQLEIALDDTAQALASDKAAINEIASQLEIARPELEKVKAEESGMQVRFQESEQNMNEWQADWDKVNKEYAEADQKVQVENSRVEQLGRHVQQLKERLDRIGIEEKALRVEDVESQITELRDGLNRVVEKKSTHEEKLSSVLNSIRDVREKIVTSEQKAADQRRQVHDVQGRLSSLEALQQSALGKTDQAVKQWMERQGIANKNRFAEQLEVDSGWETAVETVLGDTLEAICVDQIDTLCSTLSGLEKSNLSLFEIKESTTNDSGSSGYLYEKVKSSIDLGRFLDGIRLAETLEEALSIRGSLSNHESVVTRDGVWLGRNWLRITNDKDARQGVLARETEIRNCQQQLEGLEGKAEEINGELQDLRDQLHTQEQQREDVQSELNAINEQLNELKAQIAARESRQEHISNRGQELEKEKVETLGLINEEETAIEQSRANRGESTRLLESLTSNREQLELQRVELQSQLQERRNLLQQQRDRAHELEIQIEGLNTRSSSLMSNIERMEKSQTSQQQRKEELQALLTRTSEPVERLEQELKALLDQRLVAEEDLTEARRKVEDIVQLLRTLEQQRTGDEQRVQEVRSQLEQMKLDSQEIRVRSKTTLEQLAETGYRPEPLLEELEKENNEDEFLTVNTWEGKVATIAQRISRLGPINLAAIDEYQEQLKRKEYLDEQHEDVVSALDMLEKAIAKIDRETKGRFKDTFEHINNRLKDMFPRLFGGGTSYLEMTDNDLLTTGIAVMAKPPGKRISNIHLLSGGEKALTAVALVFAIFELNPAPFCMLDEVDAPLDEANVGRFSQLVKEMSKRIQFIYITHNKTTMEMSEHLSGVTMREAGVSRLVSVDVAEAAAMAAV